MKTTNTWSLSTGENELPLSAWDHLFHQLEQEFQINITLLDRFGYLTDTEGRFHMSLWHMHSHVLCQRKDTRAYGIKHCLDHCGTRVNRMAEGRRQPFTLTCWKGIKELIIPVHSKDKAVLVFLLGAFRDENRHKPLSHKVSQEITNEIADLPIIAENKVDFYGKLFQGLGKGLIHDAEEILNRKVEEGRRNEVLTYLYKNFFHQIRIEDLAQNLSLSSSRTSHIIKDEFDKTFNQLLLEMRVKKSLFLLQTTGLSAKEIGERVGIKNPHYFSRRFKEIIGATPLEFRRRGFSDYHTGQMIL